jgi:hypothetical protein
VFEPCEKFIPYDEEASSSHLTNVQYPTESSNGSKFLDTHKIGEFDFTQQCAPSPDIFATTFIRGLDEHALLNIDSMGLTYDKALSLPGQVTSSLICDWTDPLTQAFCDEGYPQNFDTADHSQNLELESSSDLQSPVDDFLLAAPSITVAQRWTKVFRTKVISVCIWFSILKVIS